MSDLTFFSITFSGLRHSLVLAVLLPGVALAGPREDAARYVNICMRMPPAYRQACLNEGARRIQRDWGSRPTTAPPSRGSVRGRHSSTVIDTTGGCEGGSCVNILW